MVTVDLVFLCAVAHIHLNGRFFGRVLDIDKLNCFIKMLCILDCQ